MEDDVEPQETSLIGQLSARRGAEEPALRHKCRGLWHTRSWSEVAREVDALASALRSLGFLRGDRMFVCGAPRPSAALALLAVERLGGTLLVSDLSPSANALSTTSAPPLHARARFALAPDRETLRDATGRLGLEVPPDVALYDVTRADAPDAYEYEELLASACDPEPSWDTEPTAGPLLITVIARQEGELALRELTAAQLLARGSALLPSDAQCSVLDALGLDDQLASDLSSLVGAWLTYGFCLHYAEDPTTAAADRRELAPTLIAGSARAYDVLYRKVLAAAPRPGTRQRAWFEWGLAREGGLGGELAERLWRAPLRDVLGLAHVEHAWVFGHPPADEAQRFFARLGLPLVGVPADALATGPSSAVGLGGSTDRAHERAHPPALSIPQPESAT